VERWGELADPTHIVPDQALVVLGVDGARFDDALAVIGTEVETGYQFVVGVWEVPEHPGDNYEHPLNEADAAVSEVFDRLNVWRIYCDPQYIELLMDRWLGRWGEKKVFAWWTNRSRQMAYAIRNFTDAIAAGDLHHDGDSTLARHIGNARRQKVNVRDEDGRQMWVASKDRSMSPRKIDAAVAAVLSWEARGDAIASGARSSTPNIRILGETS
jgi:hypothetical protein